MATKIKPYCVFRKIAVTVSERRVTKRWDVYSAEGNFHLGTIRWWTNWRRYTFWPTNQTLFDPACLREIAEFIETATKEHKENRP